MGKFHFSSIHSERETNNYELLSELSLHLMKSIKIPAFLKPAVLEPETGCMKNKIVSIYWIRF